MTQQTLETRVKDLETLVSRLNNTNAFGELRYGQPDIRSATNADLLAEVAARIAADSTLTTNLATEATTRGSADTALSASIAAIPVPLIGSPSSAFVKNADTTLANITGFAISVAASSRYAFIMYINYDSDPTPDFKFDFALPASATGNYWMQYTSTAGVATDAFFTLATTPITVGGAGAGTLRGASLQGTLITSSAGTVQIRGAQNTSDATDTTVSISSYIIAWKLS